MVKNVESFKLRGYGVIVQNLDVTEEYNYYVVVYEGDDVVTAVVCMLCVCVCVCLVCVAHCHSLSIRQSFIMTIQFTSGVLEHKWRASLKTILFLLTSNTEATENKVQFFLFSIQGKGISVP